MDYQECDMATQNWDVLITHRHPSSTGKHRISPHSMKLKESRIVWILFQSDHILGICTAPPSSSAIAV